MSAYMILMTIASAIGVPSIVFACRARKNWVANTASAIIACCIVTIIICGFARLSISINEDVVIERRTYREMVERGEIEVYDDCGHLTLEAAQYNVEIAKMHNSIRRYGRWSTWYGTGAEELEPITKEGRNNG